MKAAICCNLKKEKTKEVLPSVLSVIEGLGIATNGSINTIDGADVVITIGGDGTILHWGKEAAKIGIPLLGINTGRLGFMATLESDELYKLERLKEGNYNISKRMMMNVTVRGKNYQALNDVVFMKSTYAKLPEFIVLSKGSEVSRIRADGIIFSTPTGSTAYALSAGGPIIEPELECIEFTPLCAHTLFGRPMLFKGEEPIIVRYDGYELCQVFVSIDGDEGINISDEDYVVISKSDVFLDIIDVDKNSFYDAVHNKLMRPLK